MLDAGLDAEAGDQHAVGVTYRELPRDVQAGDTLLLNDGAIVLDRIRGAADLPKGRTTVTAPGRQHPDHLDRQVDVRARRRRCGSRCPATPDSGGPDRSTGWPRPNRRWSKASSTV